jgi:hypothetical protein
MRFGNIDSPGIPEIIGRVIELDGAGRQVVGVMAADFSFSVGKSRTLASTAQRSTKDSGLLGG